MLILQIGDFMKVTAKQRHALSSHVQCITVFHLQIRLHDWNFTCCEGLSGVQVQVKPECNGVQISCRLHFELQNVVSSPDLADTIK